MTPAERIATGERAKQAMEFLADAFAVVEADYARRMMDIAAEKPWEAEKISKLAMALKIARAARGQIEAIVSDGKAALAGQAYAGQIEKISAHKRSILGL